MNPDEKLKTLGIKKKESSSKSYLKMVAQAGNLVFTSGHVSSLKGKLGAGVTVDQGYQAAKEVGIAILDSLVQEIGSLNDLVVVKLLGCVNSDPDFTDPHLVINGASDLFHDVFGKETNGYHARSALGFASLPLGSAVEIEGIFEMKRER